jgi:hypothetical protein
MKKLFYVSALIFAVSLVSCAPSEVDDLFNESPAARLDNAVKNYTELLKSDGGRWLMQYFANEDEEGYNFIMTFHNDGSVDISTQNAYVNDGAFYTDRSTWDVVSDYGPVLSFNTFNKAFHVFSSPQSDGTGHGGDYEFIILDADKDRINMRAKKSRDKGTVIDVVMTRLSTDEYPTDEEYFTELAAVRSTAFSNRIQNYVLTTASGKRYICNGVTSMLWSFYPEDGTLLDNGEYMNAIITTEGIRFMQPLEFLTEDEPNQEDVIKVQEFAFQEDGSLLCTDDGATKITGPALADLFHQSQLGWMLSSKEGEFGGDFVTIYNGIVTEAKAKYKTTFNWLQLGYDAAKAKYRLYFKNGKYNGSIYVNHEIVDANTIKFSFDPNAEGAFDTNGQSHYNNLPSMKAMVDLLCTGEYVLSADNAMVANPMTMTSKSNSANFVVLSF